MIIYGKSGFYFPSGGIELPIFWALVQATLALIGPGALSTRAPIKTKSEVVNWFLL
jgi:hypothetical protein